MADIDQNTGGANDQAEAADGAAPVNYVDRGGPVDGDDGGSGGLGGIDAGSPGGMGGARASGGTSNGNPPGGLSPVRIEQETRGDLTEEAEEDGGGGQA
jgi:hypothetical protein